MNPSAWVNLTGRYQNEHARPLGTNQEDLRQVLLEDTAGFNVPLVPLPPLIERPLEVPRRAV